MPRNFASAAAASVAVLTVCFASPAAAKFRLCNNTSSRVGVAIGYKATKGWITEGWWNFPPRTCETMLHGALVARFYYIYAIDYDRGGKWTGPATMCTRQKEFTIHGLKDCAARGYDREGFIEVDTGEQRSWTVQLTDAPQPATASRSMAPLPMLTLPSAKPKTPGGASAPPVKPTDPAHR